MKTLIFDWSVSGHRLEYIHHLYTLALEKQEEEFVFLLPKMFNDVKEKFWWQESNNIKIFFISDKDQLKCDDLHLLKAAWYKSMVVRKAVKCYQIDRIWLLFLMHFMPFLPFLVPDKVKISGIIYRVYFYEGSAIRGIRLWIEKIRYKMMVSCSNMDKLFVLNDTWATNELNRYYKTNKFKYLPDPIPYIDDSNVYDIRNEYNISENNKVFLHFGGLDRRKGTLEILHAIIQIPVDDLKDKVFIFAGKVKADMSNEFYSLTKKINQKARILVFDEFCSYEFLYSLCYSCDCILIPYKNPNQSSGVIGYAAYFKKSVIGPNEGLLGRLIRENNIGITINNVKVHDLAKAIIEYKKCERCNNYSKTHSIDSFNKYWTLL